MQRSSRTIISIIKIAFAIIIREIILFVQFAAYDITFCSIQINCFLQIMIVGKCFNTIPFSLLFLTKPQIEKLLLPFSLVDDDGFKRRKQKGIWRKQK